MSRTGKKVPRPREADALLGSMLLGNNGKMETTIVHWGLYGDNGNEMEIRFS